VSPIMWITARGGRRTRRPAVMRRDAPRGRPRQLPLAWLRGHTPP